jgi:hypothetical protein
MPAPTSPFALPDKLLDLNSGLCRKMEFDLSGGQSKEASVDNLHVITQDLDMRQGVLGSFDIGLRGGHYEEFTIDQLRITSTTPVGFNPDALLNRRAFEFTRPASANVSAVISQNSLNRFISSPRTLQLLSQGAQTNMPSFLNQLIGAALQVHFQQAALKLLPENRVQIDLKANVDVMHSESILPVTLITRLGLAQGWVNLSDTRILTSGQELSPELSALVVGRINRLAEWGSHNNDIQFTFTQLNVIPGDRFELVGTAQIKRLRFGS